MTKAKPLPSQETLNQLLEYAPESGLLLWKERDASWFSSKAHSAEHTCNRWNSKFAGKEAMTCIGVDGYRKGTLENALYRAHRVIWKLVNGDEPENVDHINGVRTDNRIANLRSVDATGNRRNAARHHDSKAPFQGVRMTTNGMWQASITVDYKWISLGSYKTVEEAIAARKAGELAFGFHPNHGREATLSQEA